MPTLRTTLAQLLVGGRDDGGDASVLLCGER
jgi:hypothetical protein